MGKVITVWGSPGSGKSMFSCILAKALTRDKRKAIIINAEISVPMLPVWLPEQIIQTNASVGQVLSSVEIDTSLVAGHVTQVYAHILDEDRKVNAQKFEMAFYANADLRGVEQRLRAESAVAEPDSEILLKQLEAKPELMDAFTKKFVEQYGEQIMNQLAKKLIGA